MNKLLQTIWIAIILLAMPMRNFAQQPTQSKLTDYNFHNLGTIEERVFLLHAIQEHELFPIGSAMSKVRLTFSFQRITPVKTQMPTRILTSSLKTCTMIGLPTPTWIRWNAAACLWNGATNLLMMCLSPLMKISTANCAIATTVPVMVPILSVLTTVYINSPLALTQAT